MSAVTILSFLSLSANLSNISERYREAEIELHAAWRQRRVGYLLHVRRVGSNVGSFFLSRQRTGFHRVLARPTPDFDETHSCVLSI